MATLLAKLRSAASADTTLAGLLGSSPFRWYDQQLVEGTAFPAVAAFVVSRVPQYSVSQMLTTAEYRVQINVFDPNPETARAVASAIEQFLTTFNAYSAGDSNPIQPNRVVNQRDGGIVQTDPLTAMQIMDVMIWNNESF